MTAAMETIVSQCHAGVKYVLEWAANKGSRYAYFFILILSGNNVIQPVGITSCIPKNRSHSSLSVKKINIVSLLMPS